MKTAEVQPPAKPPWVRPIHKAWDELEKARKVIGSISDAQSIEAAIWKVVDAQSLRELKFEYWALRKVYELDSCQPWLDLLNKLARETQHYLENLEEI